jgi:ferredoxin
MAYVITEICLGEQYAQCVAACPVDAIYAGSYKGEPFMVIDPDTCISCGSCQAPCPIKAIVESEEQSPDWAKVNKELAAQFKNNPKVEPRPANDPPKKPGHKLQ